MSLDRSVHKPHVNLSYMLVRIYYYFNNLYIFIEYKTIWDAYYRIHTCPMTATKPRYVFKLMATVCSDEDKKEMVDL